MSEFSVVSDAVAAAGTRLGSISTGIDEIHGRLGGQSGAAAGTPADGAIEAMLARWSAVLPQFGRAGDSLSGAVSEAVHSYLGTDAAVAAAATSEQG
jgi:hypothetical protein